MFDEDLNKTVKNVYNQIWITDTANNSNTSAMRNNYDCVTFVCPRD